jgi:hypothetical protein
VGAAVYVHLRMVHVKPLNPLRHCARPA